MKIGKYSKYKKALRAMVLMGATLTVGGLISSVSAADSLDFKIQNYETRTMTVDGKEVTFRAYEKYSVCSQSGGYDLSVYECVYSGSLFSK